MTGLLLAGWMAPSLVGEKQILAHLIATPANVDSKDRKSREQLLMP